MDKQTERDTSYEELMQYLKEEELRQDMEALHRGTDSGRVNQTPPSLLTTPDPLNTAFVQDITTIEQRSQEYAQPQSQTTQAASASIWSILDKIVEEEEVYSLVPPQLIAPSSLPTVAAAAAAPSVVTETGGNEPIYLTITSLPQTIVLCAPSKDDRSSKDKKH